MLGQGGFCLLAINVTLRGVECVGESDLFVVDAGGEGESVRGTDHKS